MYNGTKRDLLSGFQYLLIGIIAEGIVLTWYHDKPIQQQMLVWIVAAFAMSFARLAILGITGMLRRNNSTTISKRHWS